MTTKTGTTPASEVGLGETYTYAELVDAPPLVGCATFDPETKRRGIVLEELDEPAGRCRMDPSGDATEWYDCDPDERMYRVVMYHDLREKPEDWQSLEHVLDAVDRGRVLTRAMPESRLSPLPPKLDDMIREVRR